MDPIPPQPNPPAPRHVAIIMDGNGRWANERGLPRIEGHRRGVESVRSALRACRDHGVRYLTLYAFSAENWSRPLTEVTALMDLLRFFLRREEAELRKHRVRLHAIGRTEELPPAVREELERVCAETREFENRHLILALNYGARTEIADAFRSWSRARDEGLADPTVFDWETLRRHLYTADFPDPDLLIRTSGETRLSNFLLLQCAYAELVFLPVLWPDFREEHLAEALSIYARRERRFGLTGEQLKPPVRA